jgi:hypothetical protein
MSGLATAELSAPNLGTAIFPTQFTAISYRTIFICSADA